MRRLALLLTLGLAAAAADAATPRPLERSGTALSHSAPEASGRNELDAGTAALWGLDAGEYGRYRALLQGPRGAFSVPGISPFEVLGIHAGDPAERRRYAERLVRLLYEDTERVLAFQREVDAAWQRLYPDTPMIDPARVAQGSAPPAPGSSLDLIGKRVAVFVAAAGCPRCDAALPRLLGLAGDRGPAAGVDLYFVDTDDEEAIRTFAAAAGIAPESVAARRITLNRGHALHAQLGGPALPGIYLRDNGRLVPWRPGGGR